MWACLKMGYVPKKPSIGKMMISHWIWGKSLNSTWITFGRSSQWLLLKLAFPSKLHEFSMVASGNDGFPSWIMIYPPISTPLKNISPLRLYFGLVT